MFPFLAPIKTANHVERIKTEHFVEITFLADSPYASRAESTASASIPQLKNLEDSDAISMKSRSSEGLNKMGSRPNSRTAAVKKTSVSSLPTSARSEGKSSPVPVKDTIPAPSRHKNKGLEMSSAMQDIFGGSTSPLPPRREKIATFNVETVRRGRSGQNLSQPGPEWFEGFEKMDNIELPPDPNCPAEKVLKGEKSTPDFDSDWQEAKEDVFAVKTRQFESIPGPDIGAGVEDEEMEEEESQALEEYESKVPDDVVEAEEKEDDTGSTKKGHPSSSSGRNSASNGESDGSRRESVSREETADDERAGQTAAESTAGGDGGDGMVLLVRNAQIINDDAIFVADILIEDGVIQNVGPNLSAPDGAEILDASGKMVLPAGIDAYTQITESTIDDVITGSKSAIAGGTATIIEVVRPRGTESLVSAVKRVKSQLEKAHCHVSLSVAIGEFNDAIRGEMSQLVTSEGVNSFVLDGIQMSDEKLMSLFEHASKLGAHIRCVPEKKSIISILERKMLKLGVTGPEGFPQSRPETLESNQVDSLCLLGNLANCPVSIVSLTSSESLTAIEKARSAGSVAHAEIASAAVAADGQGLLNPDIRTASAHLLDVPLRKFAQERLLSALSTQPLVICTSAHKPVNTASKSAKDFATAPRGSSGAEERMAVVWERAVRSGRIDPMRFVAVTSSNAAKVFNMYPKKGRIAVGADADLVVWDGAAKRVLEAKSAQSSQDLSIYEGLAVHSAIFATIVAGKVAYKDGKLAESPSPAGFLPLSPNSPYLFSVIGQRDKFGGNFEKVERDPTTVKTQQNGHNPPPKSVEFDRNRKNVMESSIDFGGASNRGRNPPGGRTTGFW